MDGLTHGYLDSKGKRRRNAIICTVAPGGVNRWNGSNFLAMATITTTTMSSKTLATKPQMEGEPEKVITVKQTEAGFQFKFVPDEGRAYPRNRRQRLHYQNAL